MHAFSWRLKSDPRLGIASAEPAKAAVVMMERRMLLANGWDFFWLVAEVCSCFNHHWSSCPYL